MGTCWLRHLRGPLMAAATIIVVSACASGDAVPPTSRPISTPTVQSLAGLRPVLAGMDLEEGVPYSYRFQLHCGMKYLADLDGVDWVTLEPLYDGVGRLPGAFEEFLVDPGEVISPVLRTQITLVTEDELELTLPDGTFVSTYRPTDDEIPGCA